MVQSKLNEAIVKGDKMMLQKALLLNPIINISDSKKNTLHVAIRCILNNNPNNFDIGLFVYLIKKGAKISNDRTNCSLFFVLKDARKYISSNKEKEIVENNIIKLIKFLADNGAKPSDIQSVSNTLTVAIRTENLKIIKAIIELNPKPDNTLCENNTLMCAIYTNNMEIVKIAIKCGALTQNTINYTNTLKYTMQFGNLEIFREIIIAGCKPSNFDMMFYEKSTFRHFYESYCRNSNASSDIIDLLMCSGAKIMTELYCDILTNPKKTQIETKLLDCYKLLSTQKNLWSDSLERKKPLVLKLQDTMNDLVLRATGECPNRKRILRNIFISIPVCCVDIIYEYQHTIPKFNVIDWSKYMNNKYELMQQSDSSYIFD
jgi:hypothetical protein